MDSKKNFPVFVSIVDDEEDLVYMYKDALSLIGRIKVFAFTDPSLALEHFLANHQKYAMVISDYRMPAMNGIELLEKMEAIDPSPVRILMSAFEIRDSSLGDHETVQQFLQKPFSMARLVNEVEGQIKKLIVTKTTSA